MRTLNLIRRHAGKPGTVERAAEALRARGAPKPLLTPIELTAFLRVARGLDPWDGIRGVGSRTVSQALGRLIKKGLLEKRADFPAFRTYYRLTAAGHDRYTALEQRGAEP